MIASLYVLDSHAAWQVDGMLPVKLHAPVQMDRTLRLKPYTDARTVQPLPVVTKHDQGKFCSFMCFQVVRRFDLGESG